MAIQKLTHVCGRGRHGRLDLSAVKPVRNADLWNKPAGGFWLSVNEGWEAWCEAEEPEWAEGPRFKATLSKNARILEIRGKADLQGLPINPAMADANNWDLSLGHWGEVYLDFETLAKEYDGVAVMVQSGNWDELYYLMYGWDCDSLVVFNPEVIENLEETEPYVCKPVSWDDDEDQD